MSLADELKKAGLKIQKSNTNTPIQTREPLWRGPERDGITQGLLQKFLACRERFRIFTTQGLKSRDTFNHRSEYGNMFHLCEEIYSKAQPERGWTWERAVSSSLIEYCKCLCKRYPTQQELVDHWYRVCKIEFPLYVEYWNNHKESENKNIIPILQEYVFNVPYRLPSGKVVKLRGKLDGVVKIGDELWLCEMKTKGDIREGQLKRQLRYDLQTMFYSVALMALRFCKDSNLPYLPYAGVRYNVIRRPLSGGKGTIVRHKPSKKNPMGESKENFYNRLAEYIKEEPEHYFMRWNISLSKSDIEKFRNECLDPVLEQLVKWWDWITLCEYMRASPFTNSIHWRHPFGCYNPLDEGGTTELDNYLETGDESGLDRVDTLFPELEGIM